MNFKKRKKELEREREKGMEKRRRNSRRKVGREEGKGRLGMVTITQVKDDQKWEDCPALKIQSWGMKTGEHDWLSEKCSKKKKMDWT